MRRADASEVLSVLLPRVSPRRTSKHEELSACCQADSFYGTDVQVKKYAVADARTLQGYIRAERE